MKEALTANPDWVKTESETPNGRRKKQKRKSAALSPPPSPPGKKAAMAFSAPLTPTDSEDDVTMTGVAATAATTPRSVVHRRLQKEAEFANSLFSWIYIPQSGLADDDEDDDDDDSELSRPAARAAGHAPSSRANTVEELQHRLKKKMEALRAHHQLKDSSKVRKDGRLTKIERKQKARDAKKMKKALLRNAASSSVVKGKKGANLASATPTNPDNNKTSVVCNDQGKMVFSKFDFSGDEALSSSKSSAAATAAGTTEKANKPQIDPKSALNRLKKRKEKLKTLEATGKTDKAKSLAEKTAWKTALDKAQGVKVKDDETLLKKSIKKMEQRKKSSKKKWEARKDHVESKKKDVQSKRTENIKKRKDQVKQKKAKVSAKRGRTVPGFK